MIPASAFSSSRTGSHRHRPQKKWQPSPSAPVPTPSNHGTANTATPCSFSRTRILDVFEDFAEDSIKRAFDDSLADPRRILRDIRTYEGASNTRLIAPDYEYDPDNTLPLVEGFSALARALVIGNARADLLPPAVSQWIQVAATYGANTIDLARSAITSDLTRAGELKKALSAGQVPTELVSRLEDAIGIN